MSLIIASEIEPVLKIPPSYGLEKKLSFSRQMPESLESLRRIVLNYRDTDRAYFSRDVWEMGK